MSVRSVRYPRALALAAWIRLFIPSRIPLLILEVNQRRTPSQWFLMVYAAFLMGSKAAMGCPEIPFLQKDLGGHGGLIIEFLKVEFDVVRTTGFKV